MSAPYLIPFNFQPTNTGSVANGSYTVPSGKYARVSATLSCSSWVSARSSTNGSTGFSECANSEATSIVIWLKAADAITVSTTTASGTSSSGGTIASSSSASILVGGTIVSSVSSPVSVTATTAQTVTLSGLANVNYHYEEFNVIS